MIMKNVLLIGDLIRFDHPPKSPGYGVYVKDKLKRDPGRKNSKHIGDIYAKI